jgi:cytochrome c oxidase subunit 2
MNIFGVSASKGCWLRVVSGAGRRSFPRGFCVLMIYVTPVYQALARQSALQPASAQAEGIANLWWLMLAGASVIFIGVMALLAIGLWRARKGDDCHLSALASRNLVITAGVAIPLVVLITLVTGSLLLGRTITAKPPDNALIIAVTGWMWWWQFDYIDERGELIATTANELHVPVGRPVSLRLTSGDVIHSFWVPELQGKTDLIPGTINTSWFTANRAGVYRGQCAEFCGVQHALMAFLVVAEPEQEFWRWLNRQTQTAVVPVSTEARRGQEVFLSSSCAGCHTIRGTSASGDLGPDLTHFGSRKTLAAASRPNTRGHLGGWISDPQSIKPGNFMPRTLLDSEELTSLIAYLESLR